MALGFERREQQSSVPSRLTVSSNQFKRVSFFGYPSCTMFERADSKQQVPPQCRLASGTLSRIRRVSRLVLSRILESCLVQATKSRS